MTGMPENRPDRLKKLQTAFAAHIRDPENQAAPAGIEDRRMKIYRDLFFNNIRSLLSSNFPVLHS
ncbi:MAG: DNA-binding domain-containing protein, partial [Xanthomonadales bacterium]|nr:DNA-binding domain-containing protein [Xanthomonadales bacterium]